jgi:hypothetical protein
MSKCTLRCFRLKCELDLAKNHARGNAFRLNRNCEKTRNRNDPFPEFQMFRSRNTLQEGHEVLKDRTSFNTENGRRHVSLKRP